MSIASFIIGALAGLMLAALAIVAFFAWGLGGDL